MLDQLRTCYWRRNESSLLCERDQEKNAIILLMNVPQGTMCLSFGPPRWHHWFMVGSSGGELVDVGLWVSGGVTTPGWTVCLTVWKPKSRISLVSDCNLIFFYHFVFFLFCFALSQIDPTLDTRLRTASNLCFSCFSLPSMHHRIQHILCLSELPISVVTGGWGHSHISFCLLVQALSLSWWSTSFL